MMKKVRMIMLAFTLLLSLSFTTKAQTTPLVISGGVTLSSGNLGENFEVGGDFGKNTLTVNLQTTDYSYAERSWYGGVKYYRNKTVTSSLSAFASAGLYVGLRESRDLVLKPGVGLNLQLAKNLYLQGSLSTPIAENSNVFRPVRLEAGTQLVLRFND